MKTLSHPERRWNPPPFLTASVGVHVAAVAAVVIDKNSWPWALGAVVADHITLTAAGLWPRSKLLGPNWTSLPREVAARGEVAVTIDDGPDPEVTPRVLDLLDAHRAKGTFFCIGELVERHSGLAKEIVRRGHSIENHTHRHLHHFSVLGPRGMTEEVSRAQETIAAVTGESPRFFRAPAGLRNPFLDQVLKRLDLRLASWTRRGFDTRNRQAEVVLNTLSRGARGGDILLLHDGHAGRTPNGGLLILEVLPRLLANLTAAGLKPVTLRSTLGTATA
jgi:peptidoglycan-N-acetylglucosamine deacetylase